MNIHDARARYTRQVIRERFLELLREKPVAKITVKELCQACEINRATFYKHYKDVFDLLEQLENQLLEEEEVLLRPQEGKNLTELYTFILQYYKSHGDDWIVLGSRNGDPEFYGKLFLHGYEKGFQRLQGSTQMPEATVHMLFYYLAHGAGGVLHCWILGEMKEPVSEVADLLARATRGAISHCLEKS